MRIKKIRFIFIGAVFQKLRHLKHTFWHVREGRKTCDGLTFFAAVVAKQIVIKPNITIMLSAH